MDRDEIASEQDYRFGPGGDRTCGQRIMSGLQAVLGCQFLAVTCGFVPDASPKMPLDPARAGSYVG